MKKWKYNKEINLVNNIRLLSTHYELADEVKEAIITISKNSYVSGSNDMFQILKNKL